MKTILLAVASAMLVAGCATDPYGSGPYGPGYGYPPPGAYPPGTYPPGSYPPGSYPPGAHPPSGDASCPIRTSRNWNAFVNRMPGPDARPQLVISGDVVTATAGYQVSFDPHLKIRESYPAQAVAVLRVRPPDGPAAQVVETHQVRWQWPLTQPVGSVEIVCEGETLARISQVQSAY